ncbi:MAG: hypothetical protein ACR2LV_11230 [Solirubrobacteraceae bacterium]
MSLPASEPATGRFAALRRRRPSIAELRASDTAKAAGLAGAMIANNVIALGSVVIFSRLLDDYGSLAALVSYVIILTVAGQAMQVATAREGVLGHLGVGRDLIATLARWTRSLLLFTLVMTVVSVLLRHQIASLVGVPKDEWAAAAGLPAGCVYLEVSILRGALQGVGDYKSVGISLVGEQAARLVLGTALVLVGLSVTGAFLGSLLSYVVMSLYCVWRLRGNVLASPQVGRTPEAQSAVLASAAPPPDPSAAVIAAPTPAGSPLPSAAPTQLPAPAASTALGLWTHVKRAWAPIAGLIVIAVLQNIDIIAAKHRFDQKVDNSYAVAAVAAKVLIWVAMGAGFYLVPEVSRRRAAGEDTRVVLARALAIIVVCAIPCLLIFGLEPKLLLKLAFGAKRTSASASLLPLGAAFTVLAATYLAIQYMLALKRTWFLIAVAAVAVAEPIFLLQASSKPAGFAAVVLGVQAVGALLAFGLALRRDSAPPAPAVSPEPA